MEAWQNEKHYSKGNNTNENPIPRQEISNQSTMRSTKVRSGHNICCSVQFSYFISHNLKYKTKNKNYIRYVYTSFLTY